MFYFRSLALHYSLCAIPSQLSTIWEFWRIHSWFPSFEIVSALHIGCISRYLFSIYRLIHWIKLSRFFFIDLLCPFSRKDSFLVLLSIATLKLFWAHLAVLTSIRDELHICLYVYPWPEVLTRALKRCVLMLWAGILSF